MDAEVDVVDGVVGLLMVGAPHPTLITAPSGVSVVGINHTLRENVLRCQVIAIVIILNKRGM